MTAIQCQDTVFLTTDFDDCVKELRDNHASFQAPLHVTVCAPVLRVGVPQIRLHDLVVELDEARTTKAAVLAVLAKYGCRERRHSSDPFSGGPAPAKPLPDFGSVITTQMT
jgi:hypothetical protein